MTARDKDPQPDPGWYYNTRTGEVEHGELSRAIDRLGPYPDRETAQRALEIARARTEEADAVDEAEREWEEGRDEA
ncbi:hypothetical protein [Haloechinothrix sp. LS1_15]|uniref:hypothetical protein n=1 Tax=Haloechinothrix sp. LS1_15 TaxID=2652248 RepID=UPI00294517EE|nr:hypothetical protein [Haloechinothrix sp. LS1_15]MDV6013816.1 hypothetical protein [Haloechinothrix sp. LS1_15]